MIKHKSAFTLVELLVVIAIIGILATIVAVSYTGAQKRSRDSKRKADVNAIASAYQMHYQDAKSWKFSNTELIRVVAGTAAKAEGSVNASNDGTGSGFFNYENGIAPGYVISMAHALSGLGYLPNQPRDPLITSDLTGYDSAKATQYMKYVCGGGILVAARLENIPSPINKNDILPGCSAQLDILTTNYKINYGVGVR